MGLGQGGRDRSKILSMRCIAGKPDGVHACRTDGVLDAVFRCVVYGSH